MNFICFQQEDGPLEEGGPPRGRGRGRGFSRGGGLRGGFRGGFSRGRGGFRGGRGNKKLLFGKSSFIINGLSYSCSFGIRKRIYILHIILL